jgi:murein DD-endopeptidase MepM/ murein hydrolase activator NlpD
MASRATQSDPSAKDSQNPRDQSRNDGVRRFSRKFIGAIAVVVIAIMLAALYFLPNSITVLPAVGESTPPPTEERSESVRADQIFLEMEDLPTYSMKTSATSIRRQSDLHTELPNRPRLSVIKYLVQEGDSLFEIAETFALKPETILWGNWITLDQDPHTLKPGQELDIPPVDGVLHTWSEGESLDAVADFFYVDSEDIIDWPGNHIEPNIDRATPLLEEGALLMIPGGRRDPPSWQMVSITRSNPAAASILGPGSCGSIYSGPVGTGVFEWPISSTWLSGYPYIPGLHEAIDIGGSIGNAIYAADTGVIVYAGWNNYGYGNVIVIDHGNGWQTLYAHLNSVYFGCGQAVFQGNKIGSMGVSGNSSGPHLHFEMRSDIWGRVNPGNFLP